MYRSILVLAALGLRICGRDPSAVNAPAIVAPPPGTPTVVAPSAAGAPAPSHGGRVQVVGNYALETVAARTGGVALFWTDLEGHPIPTSQINLPNIYLDVNGHPATVPVTEVNGAFVARATIPASAPVVVSVPYVVVAGATYENIVVPSVVVVAALPGIIVVVPPVIVAPGWHGKHRKFHGHFGWH